MEAEAIKQLIADTVAEALKGHSKALLDDVAAYMDNRTQALEDIINTNGQSNPTQPQEDAPKQDDALASRLALLETELAQTKADKEKQDRDNANLKFRGVIQQTLSANPDLMHTDILNELLCNRFNDEYTYKNGSYITKTGKTVEEEIKSFMDTDAGKHFVKPQQVAKGSNSAPADTKQRLTRNEAVKSLSQALLK